MITIHHLGISQSERIVWLMDQRLGEAPFLAGPEFTCADILVVYRVTTGVLFGARAIDDLPNVVSYVKHIEARPAYQKGMQVAGPKAVAPKP